MCIKIILTILTIDIYFLKNNQISLTPSPERIYSTLLHLRLHSQIILIKTIILTWLKFTPHSLSFSLKSTLQHWLVADSCSHQRRVRCLKYVRLRLWFLQSTLPLYVMPHFNLTITCFYIRSIKKGFGFIGRPSERGSIAAAL